MVCTQQPLFPIRIQYSVVPIGRNNISDRDVYLRLRERKRGRDINRPHRERGDAEGMTLLPAGEGERRTPNGEIGDGEVVLLLEANGSITGGADFNASDGEMLGGASSD